MIAGAHSNYDMLSKRSCNFMLFVSLVDNTLMKMQMIGSREKRKNTDIDLPVAIIVSIPLHEVINFLFR